VESLALHRRELAQDPGGCEDFIRDEHDVDMIL
jgi:hypothetical protein